MKLVPILICVAIGGCSSPDVRKVDAANSEDLITLCVTEELLREANASEEEIRQFREDEAKAEAAGEATCG